MTLYIGLFEASDKTAATTGTLRRADGSTVADVLGSVAMNAWVALADALTEAQLLAIQHVVVATNSDALFWQLSVPENFKPANETQWNVLRLLFRYQCKNGTWQIVGTTDDKLKGAKERWQQQR